MEELVKDLSDTEGIDLSRLQDNYNSLINKPESTIFVARVEKEVVGFIHLNIRQTLFHPDRSGIIEELVVTKNQLNKGIGSLLIKAIVGDCSKSGFNEIEVSTEETNVKAIKLYKKCGFEEFGIMFEKHL
jgi:ribosomal protein S18 acetylase RimI-like enzyme